MAQWYYVDKSQQRIGPMETSVLVDALRHGQLNIGSLVWQEGMPAWQPLSMHFDAIGVPESLRARKKEKSGCATWAIVLVVMGVLAIPVLGILIACIWQPMQNWQRQRSASLAKNGRITMPKPVTPRQRPMSFRRLRFHLRRTFGSRFRRTYLKSLVKH